MKGNTNQSRKTEDDSYDVVFVSSFMSVLKVVIKILMVGRAHIHTHGHTLKHTQNRRKWCFVMSYKTLLLI